MSGIVASVATFLAYVLVFVNFGVGFWATVWLAHHGASWAPTVWLFAGIPGLALPFFTPLWGWYLASTLAFIACCTVGALLDG